jgi:hypothetical protein
MKRNSVRHRCTIAILLTIVGVFSFPAFVQATDCNTKCEEHFDKWYQKPDLARCQLERVAACRWGIDHCDFYEYNQDRLAITEIIQEAHGTKNDPQDAAQCYRYIDSGSLAYTIGGAGHLAYQLAQGVELSFDPFAVLAGQSVKQILRCACDAVDWSTDPATPGNPQSHILYVNGAFVGVETGTRVEPYTTVGLACSVAQSGVELRIQSGNYPEQVTLVKPITLVAVGGTVTIGK